MDTKTYSVEEVGLILGISRSKIYDYIKKEFESGSKDFRILKIGSQYRIPKKSFDRWLDGEIGGN